MRWTAAVALGASLSMASNGCYSTYELSPQSVRALDGFHEGQHRRLDAEGSSIVFDRETRLHFVATSGESEASFSAINVAGDSFRGTVGWSKQPFAIDLKQVKSIQAKNVNAGLTAVVVLVPLVAAMVGAAVALFALNNSYGGMGFGGFGSW